ncbi:MAG: shikimate dehydrogenase [Caldisericia bacterium]|nr:shikimate dehydrogenase [Caldisericia bacterium]
MYKLYLLGYPLSHSYSPKIYSRLFKILKKDATYTLYETQKEDLKERIEELMKEKSILGFNLTQPLKEEILKFNLKLDEISEKIGSVNCVKIQDYKLFGFNTDYYGFLKSLYPYKNELIDTFSLVLGAGGASKAVILALKELKVKKSFVWNRTFEKIKKLKEIFKDFIIPIELNELKNVKEKIKLIVNATTVGLKENDKSLIEERLIHKNMIVYDLIYNPSETQLLKLAKKNGAKTKNGFTMLYFQCLHNIKIWFGGEI